MDTWLSAVRAHSSYTYKHVMVVTGLAAAFGLVFKMSYKDQERLTLGALVHDIGKTKTPLKILDKPGKLSDGELRTMRRHPLEGFEILAKNPDLGDEVATALIEARSYKRSLSPIQAYAILQEMGGKLDQDVVRAFEPIALSQSTNDLLTRLNTAVA